MAIGIFAGLAQESRLAIFRLLVREEPNGLPVGEISRRLDIHPSTLSGHLGMLKRVRLLKATRRKREIHYSANLETINGLLGFLLDDCCNGRLENCAEILELLEKA